MLEPTSVDVDGYSAVVTDVQVRLSGPLGLSVDGRVADTTRLSRHDTLALAYLVVERSRRVSRSELADVVWEERVPASWQTLLRGSMSRLRAVLGDVDLLAALLTGHGWYQLTLPGDTSVDIEVAARAAREAECLLVDAARDGAPVRAAEVARAHVLAETAHEVARQPFLAGVDAAWVGLRQQLLDDLRLHCLELIARAALHSGDWNDARHGARLALGRAPLRESVYRLLALAHCGAGDRGEALRVLATCRRVLAEELGAGPSPETDALNTGLLRGVPVADLLSGVLSPAAVPVRHGGAWPAALRRLTEAGTPFVGRGAESDQLRDAWKRAEDGTPQVVLVAGEAGAGKSRIIAEFAATVAANGPTILYGQCDGTGGVLVEALGGHLADHARAAPHAAGLAEAVRSTLCRLGQAGPVLLVMEDLHELERDGMAMLRYVLRCPDPLPLLVAGTFRTGDPAASRRVDALLAAWRSAVSVARIELTGLPEGQLVNLVRLLAGRPPAEQLASTIADATGGNPFFVRELVQLWDAQGRIAIAGDELVLVDASADSVPAGVRETILARCAPLGEATRRVLGVAAVAGREVDLRILEAVPELSTVDVLEALEEAVASHLMTELPGASGRFAFVHGLVPETLYRELTATRRQRLHADLATAIEARPGGALNSVTRVAQHLLQGGTGVSARAATAAARAGADAASRHAYDEATQFFAAAVDRAGPDPVARCRLRLQLAEARWRSGDTAGAGAEFRAATALARLAGRPDLASRAVFGATSHGPNLLGCDRAAANEIADVLPNLDGADPYRPRLLGRLGAELAGAPDPRSRDHCLEALALAEAGPDESTIAYALNCLNWAGLGHPPDPTGLARADRMLALADGVDDRHMMLEARLWRATFLLQAGRLDEVGAEATALEELAVELRQPFYLRLPLRLRATLAALEGRAEEAAMLAAEVYPMERQAHAGEAEAHALLRAVAIAPALQRWPDPRGALSTLEGPPWAAVRAVCLAGTGRVDDAAKALAPVLADSGAALRHHILAPFVAALLARSCADDEQWTARVDQAAVRSVLLPWAGAHVVAGCGVASLGPVDGLLAGA